MCVSVLVPAVDLQIDRWRPCGDKICAECALTFCQRWFLDIDIKDFAPKRYGRGLCMWIFPKIRATLSGILNVLRCVT